MDSITIVVPAYNEERRLPATLSALVSYLERSPGGAAEILVVDDGSSDATAAVVEDFARGHASVRLLKNPGNRGKGYSVRHGMLEAKGDWILFTDADLSTPIEELDNLRAVAARTGADIAIGSRALDRSLISVHQSVFRENAGRVFNFIVRLLTGLPFHDTQCGFKLFTSAAARQVFPRQRLERFGFDVEVLFIAQRLGFHAIEVPVRWSHAEGTKVRMFGDSLNMLLDLFRVRWNHWRGRYD